MQVRVQAKLGLVLIVTACLLWVAGLVVPFLPCSIPQKALIVTSLVIVSEVIFWLGILLAGTELAHRYRHQLNPTFVVTQSYSQTIANYRNLSPPIY